VASVIYEATSLQVRLTILCHTPSVTMQHFTTKRSAESCKCESSALYSSDGSQNLYNASVNRTN